MNRQKELRNLKKNENMTKRKISKIFKSKHDCLTNKICYWENVLFYETFYF